MNQRPVLAAVLAILLAGCTGTNVPQAATPSPGSASTGTGEPGATGPGGLPFVVQEIARVDQPWAMTFLPDGRALITSRTGELHLRDVDGRLSEVSGGPDVVVDGQGGLGDVVAAPDFATSRQIFLSWVEAGTGGSGAVVGRARLAGDEGNPRLEDLAVIWRQQPKVGGSGHFSHRLAFSPDGSYLYVSSGERQKMDPAQDLAVTLGKIVRLRPDGSPAPGNPFADRGGVSAQIWSYGHRNPLGLAFDPAGNLWSSEMGPMGGDEVNLIRKGANYGWPAVSNGSQYGGADIPDHTAGDGFEAPKVWWNPSISPSSLMIYTGSEFPQWRGDAFVGALSGEALIRVDVNGTDATKGDQWGLGQRVREVEQAPDGAIWLLTDDGRVLELTAP